MTRLVRAALLLLLGLGLGVTIATASAAGTPSITGLSEHVVNAGDDLVVSGSSFSSDAPLDGDCSAAGVPTVHFTPTAGGPAMDVQPAGTDGAHCSNTAVHVAVPAALTGAAMVSLTDPQGHNSNDNQLVTLRPTGSLTPSAGGVGASVSIQGSGFRPTSVSGPLTETVNSSPVTINSWSDTSIPVDPHNSTVDVYFNFSVANTTDANSPTSPVYGSPGLHAGTFTFRPPNVTTASIDHQFVGNPIDIEGTDLGTGGTVLFPGISRGQPAAWSPTKVTVTIPYGAQPGNISLQISGYGQVGAVPMTLNPKATGFSPRAATAGQQVRITGYNFGSEQGLVAVDGPNQQVASWGDNQIVINVSQDNDGGTILVRRPPQQNPPDNAEFTTIGPFTIIPHLDRTESNAIHAGDQLVLDGASLGAQRGRVNIGPASAGAQLWSRDSVLTTVPTSLTPGTYPVSVTTAAGATSNALSLTIIAGAPVKPPVSAATGAPTGAGGALAPSFDNNHQFVKPIKPPSPVYFNVSTDPKTVKPGGTSTITVTLKLNDKPVSGADVHLAMLFTPGNDYKFTPDSGTTDVDGIFKATVQVSKNPGDSVIAATSGVFSDQDHVTGTGAAKSGNGVTTTNPAATANGGFAPLLIIGVIAIALVSSGFYLNMRSMRG